MKNPVKFGGFLCALFMISCFTFCTSKVKTPKETTKIENTLKSVSFLSDSVKVVPSDLLVSLEYTNHVIDSLGYPDAGYKLWIIQSDTAKNIRFMIEGYWPDQATYDLIHRQKEYRTAFDKYQKVWEGLKIVSYKRFVAVK